MAKTTKRNQESLPANEPEPADPYGASQLDDTADMADMADLDDLDMPDEVERAMRERVTDTSPDACD